MECCAVVDLRQYTLYPGRRDTLIDLFDEEFVEGQEAYGLHLPGQFRDLDDEDRFVWLRGFPSLAARAEALTGFYSGPVWKAHSAAANATMKDSDDALLLRPLQLAPEYPGPRAPRPPRGATAVPGSVIAGAVYHRPSLDDGFADYFAAELVPALTAVGAAPIATFETLPAENNFPALPLRDESVFVWLTRFAADTEYERFRRAELPDVSGRVVKPTQLLRLRPTARSQLR